MTYEEFLKNKAILDVHSGMTEVPELNPRLHLHQPHVVRWALKKGRAAIFAGTGLGKTFMQLEWADKVQKHTGGHVLILAPLAVSDQTVSEGREFGISVTMAASDEDVIGPGIYITNYGKAHKFDLSRFIGVVLDESSCLKHEDSKTKQMLVSSFRETPWKLACTATPAPNDYTELGNHAEFLGVMTMQEMLSMFFVHDAAKTQDWRLKGHAKDDFWKWMASWAVAFNKPSDLGFEDGAYALPPLRYHTHILECDGKPQDGMLFSMGASSLNEVREAKRDSLEDRCKKAGEIVDSIEGPVAVWCDLNEESDILSKSIPGAVEVKGSDSDDHKSRSLSSFARGEIRALVSKTKICGFGMNFQVCNNTIFVSVNHSFESLYQAIRRFWRFGQKKPVNVHLILSSEELSVLESIKRKESEAEAMTQSMVENMAEITKSEIQETSRTVLEYAPSGTFRLPAWIKENAHLSV